MRKHLLVLGGLLVLAVVVFFAVRIAPYIAMAASLWRALSTTTVEELAQREERVLEQWKSEVTGGTEPWERYPPREVNATALALEAIATELGIDCSTPHHPTTPPEPSAAESWNEVGQTVKEYFEALRTSSSAEAPPLPTGLREWLAEARDPIDRALELLLSGDQPHWERDLEAGAESPLPNLLCHLDLHRVLLLGALQAEDENRAASVLEAAWLLRQAPETNPAPIAQLIHFVELGDELSVLRRSCAVGGRWEERLRAFEPRATILRSIQIDGWLAYQTFRTDPMFYPALGEDGEMPLFSRLVTVGFLEAVQHAVERLETQDPLSHDPKAFSQELSDRLPRFSILARLFTPQPGAWIKAVRIELVIEHALRLLRAQEQLARGEEPAATRKPSEAVAGLFWTDEPTATGIRISLDGDLNDGNTAPVSLDFELDKGICGHRAVSSD